ncbi:hypothetical protein NSIN_30337 [Nitrosotalea sinensis]|uniref:DOT1 domain-containing protein n=1 Tax=Nitrosotalea sinensis TaxID=1499975 RepID=A0A2H1EIJ0_9ARCH|nr:hypothetical protein [Candidatus Nitrosotalea sinensis]SHO47071.1 hypothetical protein NSIN_30337 [Candidatus Nitrosotalea sinensis]
MKEEKRPVIDDTRSNDDPAIGPPIMFTNPHIRKMFNFVNASNDDVFYDLGSGWAQNIIIGITEFNLKKCIGIESDEDRYQNSIRRLKKYKIPKNRAKIIHGKFEDLFENKIKGVNLKEATIIFYGLETTGIFTKLKKNIRDGCKLVYYNKCLFPEIKANDSDYPFYVSISPFDKPLSAYDWLSSIIKKEKSSINKNKKPAMSELWNEFFHDFDVEDDRDLAEDYRDRLKKIFSNKS